jgi:hypothetical protein
MATIKDVAREANVSVATVSRAFNSSGPVSEETRARIQGVVARLCYSPHGAARSLTTSRTSTLGVLLPNLYGEFFSEVIRGMDQTAQRSGYQLLVSSSHDAKAEIEAALRAMRGRVDGLIAMSPHLDAPSLVANVPATLPVVLLNCQATGDAYDALTIENQSGAYQMIGIWSPSVIARSRSSAARTGTMTPKSGCSATAPRCETPASSHDRNGKCRVISQKPRVSRRSSVSSRCATDQRPSSRRTMRWRSAH